MAAEAWSMSSLATSVNVFGGLEKCNYLALDIISLWALHLLIFAVFEA
jgi:hypothetical protein